MWYRLVRETFNGINKRAVERLGKTTAMTKTKVCECVYVHYVRIVFKSICHPEGR